MTEDEITLNQDSKKLILVNDKNPKNFNLDKYIQSRIIICPECHESASIHMEDYLISISNCKNGHKIDNIPINEFENLQKIDRSKFVCDSCKKNNFYNDTNINFFKCLDCHKSICENCQRIHTPEHNIINYENIFAICEEHGKEYIAYCFDCKTRLCFDCSKTKNLFERN